VADAVTPVQGRRLGHIDYKWVALAVVLIGTIMTILDATIVNIALVALQTDFSAISGHQLSYNDISWVVTGYLLAQGAVIPMTGWATDRWGTKRLYLITIAMFTLASMACGVAQNLPELIFFRVLQGLGGGMLMPIGMTIILHAVGPKNMGKVMGIFGIPMLLAPALGPVLGGWFVQDFSWRLIFYVNVPIGILAFLGAWYFLVESERSHKLRLDVYGLITATPAVLAVMYAVDRSNELGWGSALVVGLLVAAVSLFAAFVLSQTGKRHVARLVSAVIAVAAAAFAAWEWSVFGLASIETLSSLAVVLLSVVGVVIARRDTDQPLLYLALFRDATFGFAMILSFIVVTALFGAMLLLPIYLQQVKGESAINTGLLLLPQAIAAAIAMPLGGFLSDRFGPRPVVSFGIILIAAAGVLLAQIQVDSGMGLLIVALALRGFAMGFCMMPTQAAALARVPRQFSSRASSITNTLQRVGSSIGIAVLVTVLAAQAAPAAQEVPCTVSAPTCAAVQNAVAHPSQSRSQGQGQPVDPTVAAYANSLLSKAFDRTFAFIAILTAFGLIPAWFLRKPDHHVDAGVAAEMAA
jgi:MFS family permease